MRNRPRRFACHFLQVIRTFGSIIICTSSFWHLCQKIGVLNNFPFNFLEFLN
ncbi:MAG: hypothetical protein K6253_02810 [Candidatus Liberibacter asiaticus]|nr:hypothetical protein [Candidatus Liberibacter asiaticus]